MMFTAGEIRIKWLVCECGCGWLNVEARSHSNTYSRVMYRCDDCGSVGVQEVTPASENVYRHVDVDLRGCVKKVRGAGSKNDPLVHRTGHKVY